MVLKLRSIAPAIVPVAMNGAFDANATVAHRFTCLTYGCWYAIVASPRTAPPPFDEIIEEAAAFQNGERARLGVRSVQPAADDETGGWWKKKVTEGRAGSFPSQIDVFAVTSTGRLCEGVREGSISGRADGHGEARGHEFPEARLQGGEDRGRCHLRSACFSLSLPS